MLFVLILIVNHVRYSEYVSPFFATTFVLFHFNVLKCDKSVSAYQDDLHNGFVKHLDKEAVYLRVVCRVECAVRFRYTQKRV